MSEAQPQYKRTRRGIRWMENSFRITDRRESYEKKGKGRWEEREGGGVCVGAFECV